MSGIIKSGNVAELSVVRPLILAGTVAETPAVSRQEEERDRLRRRAESLEAELRQRDATIGTLKADVKRAYDEGLTEGRKAGFAEAEDRQSERLSILERATQRTQDEITRALQSLDRLSVLLARDSLEIILGDPDHRAELLRKTVAAQVARIEKSVILSIELSREDFPNEKSLAAVAKRSGVATTILNAGSDIPSGGCVMTLRLGRLEIGVNQQWGVLRELLTEMAEPEVSA